MDQKALYAFRGWIAFVAFMDLGNAVRSYIEKRSYLGEITGLLSDALLPRVLGVYSILKAVALIHCTLFIHYKPVVSLGEFALLITILLHFSEVFYFQSIAPTFHVVFQSILNGITLMGLVFLPKRLLEPTPVIEDENTELLKQANVFKRRRNKKAT
ncbi:hypothetical protein R5R35_013490 [Gryllus longicercus]|uniref:Uncharacterized protein n=1 Tax=Gryllus longicercus TaxID=2509291 RepID=A0AAN9VRD8_9ORTH